MFLKLQNHPNGDQISDCQGLRSKWGQERSRPGQKQGNTGVPCCDGNILYLDFTKVDILVVILYYNFAICHHWEGLGTQDLSV